MDNRADGIVGSLAILLLDLDNTLIERDAAFLAWARVFLERHAQPSESDLAWLVEQDGDGYMPREDFMQAVRGRFGLGLTVDALLADYAREYPTFVSPPSQAVFDGLAQARSLGWKIGIVTNGNANQLRKIDRAGLRHTVDGWCISEEVGTRKPERRIFELAAEACGCRLEGWMVGDNDAADIAGGVAAGLRTAWLHRGRAWSHPGLAPDLRCDSVDQAIAAILSAGTAPLR